MEEVYGKLKFPPYFGRNWSAFSDSFQERLWQDEDHYQKYLLVFTDADDLLAEAVDNDLSALLETLQDTIEALADPESLMAIKVVFCLKDAACSRVGVGIINGHHKGKVVQSDRSTPPQQTAPAAG
ncbi:MAG: barstar family protein [Leptolyngbya sp. RL_3_1]|nr:barstar family protein [Leptolyngbya sp. RL_3_1]